MCVIVMLRINKILEITIILNPKGSIVIISHHGISADSHC